jgi:hypothetical protein
MGFVMVQVMAQEFFRNDPNGGHWVRGVITGRVGSEYGPVWVTGWQSRNLGDSAGDAEIHSDPDAADGEFMSVVDGMTMHGWNEVGVARHFNVWGPATGTSVLDWAEQVLLPSMNQLWEVAV